MAGMLLTLLLAYLLAVKRTVEAYRNYTAASQKAELADNAPMLQAQLEKELMQMDAKLAGSNSSGKPTEQQLLEQVTNYCQDQHIVLREFPQATSALQGDMLVETNRFTVEGNFAALLNLVYILEQKNRLGKIVSVHYALGKDMKTKEMLLTATVFLQNVKKQEHEK